MGAAMGMAPKALLSAQLRHHWCLTSSAPAREPEEPPHRRAWRFALPLRSQAPYHPAVPPPRAAPDRPELIFADSTNQIVSVAVAPGPAFSFSASSPLFGIESLVMPPYHQGFAIAPDDKSFIFLEDRSDLGQRGRSAVLTLNWLDGLTSPRLDK